MNIRKLDERDVVFLDEPWTSAEKEKFSELLKKKKNGNMETKIRKNAARPGLNKQNSAA